MGALRSPPLTATFRAARIVACVTVWACGAVATAQAPSRLDVADLDARLGAAIFEPCGTDRATVEVAGIGLASFDEIAFDATTDVARLEGRVCIDLPVAQARLRADAVRIEGVLAAAEAGTLPTVEARWATLSVGPWSLAVQRLVGTTEALVATGVVIRSNELVLVAAAATVRGADLELVDVTLATRRYLVEAVTVGLAGDRVEATTVQAWPCNCAIDRYRIAAEEAIADLGGDGVALRIATWRIAGFDVPLGRDVVVGRDGIVWTPPLEVLTVDPLGSVVVARVEGVSTVVEVGTSIGASPVPVVGVSSTLGTASFVASFDPRGLDLSATRDVGAGTFEVRVDLADDRPWLRWGVRGRGPSTAWTRSLGAEEAIHASLATSWRTGVVAEPGAVPGEAGGVGIVSSGSLEGDLGWTYDVAGGTAVVQANVVVDVAPWVVAPADGSTIGAEAIVRSRASAAWSSASTTVRTTLTRVTATHEAPFTSLAVEERARVAATFAHTAPWGGVGFDVERSFGPEPATFTKARAIADAPTVRRGPVTVDVGARFDAEAAWNEGAPLDVTVSAALRHAAGTRIAAGATFEFPGTAFLPTDATLDASVPLRLASRAGGEGIGIVATPTVGVDLAPSGDGWRASWARHGLTFDVEDCCVTWRVGYAVDGDSTTFVFGVDLPPFLGAAEETGDPGAAGPVPLPPRYRPVP